MSYTKYYNPALDNDQATPVTSEAWNHVETGLEAAAAVADAAIADPGGRTEGDALQIVSGSPSWSPLPSGTPAGAGALWFSTVAPSGYAILDGSTLTGAQTAYPDLWANVDPAWKSGTDIILPDLRGRTPVGLGSHADVSAFTDNDGEPEANRTPKHDHTNGLTFTGTAGTTGDDSPDHVHGIYDTGVGGANGEAARTGLASASATTGGASTRHQHPFTPAGTIGGTIGQSGGPTDAPGFQVVNFIIKLTN